jgi:hypothetical protein
MWPRHGRDARSESREVEHRRQRSIIALIGTRTIDEAAQRVYLLLR